MITAQEESFSQCANELIPLTQQHYEEISLHVHRFPLAVAWQQYFLREANGELLVVTLRENGFLVGYFMGFITPGLHYQTCLTLQMDVFYILSEARNKGAGAFRLFRKVERCARQRGVNLVQYGSKLHKDSGRLFKALGFRPTEMWYGKFLED